MRFFAQANEVFDGDQPAREAEDHVDGDEAPQLKPGESRAVDPNPQGLSNNDLRIGRRLAGKTAVEIIRNGKHQARERHDPENEESPARPNGGKRKEEERGQPAPADKHHEDGR